MTGPPSAPNSPIVQVSMTDEDIIERVAEIFDKKYQSIKARKDNWKPTFCFKVKGIYAVKIMKELKPLMGIRRQSQITRAIESLNIQRKFFTDKEKSDIIKAASKGTTSQQKIADMYGCSREYVNKLLARYKNASPN